MLRIGSVRVSFEGRQPKAGWRVRYFAAAFFVSITAIGNFGLRIAEALSDGGYPWVQAHVGSSLSEWYVDEDGNGYYSGDASSEAYDPYGFTYRNCTSYVAWKLATLGFVVPYGRRLGNANTWDDNARRLGYDVDKSPRPGDVAVWNRGYWGHVAFVESVDDGGTPYDSGDDSVKVSEYNYAPAYKGLFGVRQKTTADYYIHFLPATAPEPATAVPAIEPVVPAAPGVPVQQVENAVSAVTTTAAVPVPAAPTPDYTTADFLSADLNGDGRSDLVVISPHAGGGSDVFWQLSLAGGGFAPMQYLLAPTGFADNIRWLAADVNADGKTDVLAYVQTAAKGPNKLTTNVLVMVSQGTTLAPANDWGDFDQLSGTTSVLVSDRDGDRNQDLLILTKLPGKSPNIVWLRSTGSSFSGPNEL